MLHRQRPDAPAPVSQENAHGRRRQRAAQGGKKEPFKEHVPGHIGMLDILHAGDHQRQSAEAHQCGQFLPAKEGGNDRSRGKEAAIEHQAHDDAEIEHRGEVQIVGILFLDQGIAEAAVHKGLQNCGEGRHQRQRSVNRRVQQPRQHDGDHKRDSLGTAPLQKAPEHIPE